MQTTLSRDDIIRMAREAGLAGVTVWNDEEQADVLSPDIEEFANIISKYVLGKSYPEIVSIATKHAIETVAAAEREACIEDARTVGGDAGAEVEKLIRARGQG